MTLFKVQVDYLAPNGQAWMLLGDTAHIQAGGTVVDVSGDGVDNCSTFDGTLEERDKLVAAGVTINGLPIIEASEIIEDYYRDQIIGGPGAFIEPATNILAFGAAMGNKLLRELQDLSS